MEFRLKNRKVQIVAFFVLFIFAIKYSDLFLELPEAKRPVREAAMMTMALNPDKTEEVRLKIPWGYLATNVSYMSAKDQNAFFANANSMMRLMGLPGDILKGAPDLLLNAATFNSSPAVSLTGLKISISTAINGSFTIITINQYLILHRHIMMRG